MNFQESMNFMSGLKGRNSVTSGLTTGVGKTLQKTGINRDEGLERIKTRYNIAQGLTPEGNKRVGLLGTIGSLAAGIVTSPITNAYRYGGHLGNLAGVMRYGGGIEETEGRAQGLYQRSLKTITDRYKAGQITKAQYRKELERIGTEDYGSDALAAMTPTKGQLIGTGLTTALDVATAGTLGAAPIKGAGSVLKTVNQINRIGAGAGIGATYGGLNAVAEGGGAKDILAQAAIGSAIGPAMLGAARLGTRGTAAGLDMAEFALSGKNKSVKNALGNAAAQGASQVKAYEWGPNDVLGIFDGSMKRKITGTPKFNMRNIYNGITVGRSVGGDDLGNIVDFPELYKEYPWLKKIKVKSTPYKGDGVGGGVDPKYKAGGKLDRDNTFIEVRRISDAADKETLIHELTHIIQEDEFAWGGGSPEMQMLRRLGYKKDYYKSIADFKKRAAAINKAVSKKNEQYFKLVEKHGGPGDSPKTRKALDELKELEKKQREFKKKAGDEAAYTRILGELEAKANQRSIQPGKENANYLENADNGYTLTKDDVNLEFARDWYSNSKAKPPKNIKNEPHTFKDVDGNEWIATPDGKIYKDPIDIALGRPVQGASLKWEKAGKYAERPTVVYDGGTPAIGSVSTPGSTPKAGIAQDIKPSAVTETIRAEGDLKIRLVEQIKRAVGVMGERKAENVAGHVSQAKRFNAAYNKAIKAGKTKAEARTLGRSAMGGEFARKDKGLFQLDISPGEYEGLIDIMQKNLRTVEFGARADETLSKLINGGELTKGDIKFLSRGLGMDLAPLMRKVVKSEGTVIYTINTVGNTMRTSMTVGDLSAMLRQNFTAFSRNPIMASKIFAKDLKYWGLGQGEDAFNRGMEKIKQDPNWKYMKDSGLVFNDVNAGTAAQNEYYAGAGVLEHVPGVKNIVRPSERHFTGVGNDIRAARFNRYVEDYAQKGITPDTDPDLFKGLATLINASTGVGPIPERLEGMRTTLNAVLFSPRLLSSRLYYLNPGTYFGRSTPKAVRMEAAKDLGSMVAVATGALLTAKALGAEVELDPRSSDFGKVKYGNTRFEITGGFTPYLRTIAQFATGQSKKTDTGAIVPTSAYGQGGRIGTVTKFARSKLNPLAGTIVDVAQGENMLGEPTTARSVFANSLPMMFGDMYDAMTDEERNNFKSLMVLTGSIVGVGANTYGGAKDKAKASKQKAYVKKLRKKPVTENALDRAKYRITGLTK